MDSYVRPGILHTSVILLICSGNVYVLFVLKDDITVTLTCAIGQYAVC